VLDYVYDPSIAIAALASFKITTMGSVQRTCSLSFSLYNADFDVFRQLSDQSTLFADVMKTVNGADNVTIAPRSVVEKVSRIMFIFFFSLLSFHCARIVKRQRMHSKRSKAEESEEMPQGSSC
jgi:hypothetical protein